MRGPSAVTATVCSKCAARLPSRVTAVHPTPRIRTSGLPIATIGSIASTMPSASFGPPGKGVVLEEGMVLAIEPMVTAGRHLVRMGDDGWAIYSQDSSATAHFEFTVAITADGPRILTPWHETVLLTPAAAV